VLNKLFWYGLIAALVLLSSFFFLFAHDKHQAAVYIDRSECISSHANIPLMNAAGSGLVQSTQSLPKRRYVPKQIRNAGFEASKEPIGWQRPPNVKIVENDPAQGNQCVRLEVLTERERGVYITQLVPVEPGCSYSASAMIRATDVKPARVLGMKSVGAVLIVEWADNNGNWMAGGGYSQKAWFGTRGWTRHQCKDLIAPPKAAFAIIFLALRGVGTAWFDDIRFTESCKEIVLTSPRDGATLKENRPLLQWQEDLEADEYEVQLSTSRSFPKDNSTLVFRTKGNCLRPDRPLAPVKWFWRVRITPYRRWSPVLGFIQTAPMDADTTGPEIYALTRSITDAKQPLKLKIMDQSGLRPGSLQVSGIKGRTFETRLKGNTAEVYADGGWPRGAHYLKFMAEDSLGNGAINHYWVVVAPPPPLKFQWTANRGVFDEKRTFFPLGIYEVTDRSLKKVKHAGFTLVHLYKWEWSQDESGAKAYLDRVHANGLKAFIGFDRGRNSKQGLIQLNYAHVAQRIALLRDHPGLLAWYLFDEPDLSNQYVAPRNLESLYNFIKALDPYHPVVVTFVYKDSIARYGKGCYDVYWAMCYDNPEVVDRRLENYKNLLGSERPYLAILHSFDRGHHRKSSPGLSVDHISFRPDLKMFRANAYLAIAHGSSGLCWWWYGDDRENDSSVSDVPIAWQWLSRVAGEIRQLEPLLTARARDLPLSVQHYTNGIKVRTRAIITQNAITIIAVNPDPTHEAQVAISSKAFPQSATAKVRFEDRGIKIEDQELNDSFEPYAVHVYEIKRSP
jgi:hypothetical protein